MGLFGISGDTLKDTVQLLKNTFTIIARNPAIFKPTVTQIVVGIFLWVLVIGSFASFYFVPGAAVIAGIILIFSVVMLILFPFIKMYYRAAQCWIVYKTFTGNKISYNLTLWVS